MDASFWNGRRVLVTGHTGFKGSWLCLWLDRLGAEVTGYALAPPTEPSLFESARVDSGVESVEGDVRNLERLSSILRDRRPEVVIHLAAQALVRRSYTEPVETYTTNVLGTLNLLEALRLSPDVRVAVLVTSDKCYENREWVWGYRESDRLGGHDPYASSKACAELTIAAYRDSFFSRGPAVASARAGNVIGGGDWAAERLVPDIVRAMLEGRPAAIRNPRALRPWQYVLEPLGGYLQLAERLWDDPSLAQAWNFGPRLDQIHPVSWIADHLTSRWGDGASWETDAGTHPPEDHFLKLDCTKAASELGWSPRLDLDTALDWIVEWFRGFSGGIDARRLCDEQIVRYEGLAP